jgi:hypothetical protein
VVDRDDAIQAGLVTHLLHLRRRGYINESRSDGRGGSDELNSAINELLESHVVEVEIDEVVCLMQAADGFPARCSAGVFSR